MILTFGSNRRQKPLVLKCPGGTVTISREFGGSVRVQIIGERGAVEVENPRSFITEVTLGTEEANAQRKAVP